MPVDRLKKKKDGTYAYKDECQGLLLRTSQCEGDVALAAKRAQSFGQPFVTHSLLCEKHATELGFAR